MTVAAPDSAAEVGVGPTTGLIGPALRILGLGTVAIALVFIFNNYLIHWQDWPGLPKLFAQMGLFGLGPLRKPLDGGALTLGLVQLLTYMLPVIAIVAIVWRVQIAGAHCGC